MEPYLRHESLIPTFCFAFFRSSLSFWTLLPLPSAYLSGRCYDVSDANQIINGVGKPEHPSPQLQPLVTGLSHQANRLHPAEDLFHQFSLPLTDVVARVSGRA